MKFSKRGNSVFIAEDNGLITGSVRSGTDGVVMATGHLTNPDGSTHPIDGLLFLDMASAVAYFKAKGVVVTEHDPSKPQTPPAAGGANV